MTNRQKIIDYSEKSNTKRAFLMGNALVVGIVEKIGNALNIKLKQ